MTTPRDPDAHVKGVASAMDMVSKVGAAVVVMVVPGVVGLWLDKEWDTGFLALLGFLFGVPMGIYYLLEISGAFRIWKRKSPKSQSPSNSPPTDDHERDRSSE
jgi:hypothetical protein